mgnify:CR=1 FL=1
MPSFALAAMHWAGDERIKALLLKYRDRTVVEAVGSGRNTETAKAILDGTLSAQSLNVDDPSHTDLAEQFGYTYNGISHIVNGRRRRQDNQNIQPATAETTEGDDDGSTSDI